jgi:hypothetical protein
MRHRTSIDRRWKGFSYKRGGRITELREKERRRRAGNAQEAAFPASTEEARAYVRRT